MTVCYFEVVHKFDVNII